MTDNGMIANFMAGVALADREQAERLKMNNRSAAMVEQTALRKASAACGGINPMCRELGVTRQSFYAWEQQEGATPVYAILMARLTGMKPLDLCSSRYHDQLLLILDYFARR